MPARERTSDFVQIVEEVRLQTGLSAGRTRRGFLGGGASGSNGKRWAFGTEATQMYRSIRETKERLKKLTKLSKNTSLFNDSSTEVAVLTQVVKEDLTALSRKIEELQQYSLGIGASAQNKHTEMHAAGIIAHLKLHITKATTRFKAILENRTKAMQRKQEKMHQLLVGDTSPTSPSVPRQDEFVSSSTPPVPRSNPYSRSTTPSYELRSRSRGGMTSSSSSPSLLMTQQQQQQTTTYNTERLQTVETIESTIVELQGIFQQLANVVVEQGEMIQRIDLNVMESGSHVEKAQVQLVQFLKNVSGNRALVVKVFVALIFIILVVMFLYR